MNRQEFEHVIKAAVDVVGDELVVVGSQAVLAHEPNPPASLMTSMELDIYPLSDPDRAREIDGSLGDGSRFHETYHYYAHGVGPETICAPAGWEGRLVRLEFPAIKRKDGTAVAWCLSMVDLMMAKLAAGRAHDIDFVLEALRAELVEPYQLELGVDLMPKTHRERTRERLAGVLARLRAS